MPILKKPVHRVCYKSVHSTIKLYAKCYLETMSIYCIYLNSFLNYLDFEKKMCFILKELDHG